MSTGAPDEVAEAAGNLFESYAEELLAKFRDHLLDIDFVIESGHSAWITYPVRCLRIAEILGLLSLRLRDKQPDRSAEVADMVAQFVEAQPGCVHPISDRFAVSLIPMALASASSTPSATKTSIRQAAIWLCDFYERGRLGLAGLRATPLREIERLVGSSLESVKLDRRGDSEIATVLLDLTAALNYEDLYADLRNDFLAVDIIPRTLRIAEGPDQFMRTGSGNRLDPHVDFAEELDAAPPIAPHHLDAAGKAMCEQGRSWDLLAFSSALRDRHFYRAVEMFGP